MIKHWRLGAKKEMQSAKILFEGGQHVGALFHCHLSLEKELKALYMEQHCQEAPFTHDLTKLALQLQHPWTDEEKKLFADLSGFSIAARYDDPLWAEREATHEHVGRWIR